MPDHATENPSATDFVAKDDIATETFTVSVKGNGVELTRKVDQATALNVIATVLGGAAVQTAPAHVPVASVHVGTQRDTGNSAEAAAGGLDPRMTIGEYLDECEARQFPAKITAIGNFLELKLGQKSFTREEVKSQFRPAGEALPGNFSRDFNDAITQRWIAEDRDVKGQYFVANKGKAAIAAKFDKSTRRTSPTARRRKSASKSDNGDSSSTDATDFQDLNDE